MKSSYKTWLEQQGYVPGTVQTQRHRAGRVEEFYGNLDENYDQDQLRTVIGELTYELNRSKVYPVPGRRRV